MPNKLANETPDHAEERRRKQREYVAAWKKTPKGIASTAAAKKRWRAKQVKDEYTREQRRLEQKTYYATPAGHAARMRASAKYQKKIVATPEGQAKRNAKARDRWNKSQSRSKAYEKPLDMMETINAAVSRRLMKHDRDAVISDMVFAVLEGRLLLKDIANRSDEFRRQYDRKFNGRDTLSLDASIPGMEGVTYLDRLADESEEYHEEEDA